MTFSYFFPSLPHCALYNHYDSRASVSATGRLPAQCGAIYNRRVAFVPFPPPQSNGSNPSVPRQHPKLGAVRGPLFRWEYAAHIDAASNNNNHPGRGDVTNVLMD